MLHTLATGTTDWIGAGGGIVGTLTGTCAVWLAARANRHSKKANEIADEALDLEKKRDERERQAKADAERVAAHHTKIQRFQAAGRDIAARLADIRFPESLDSSEKRDAITRAIQIEQTMAIRHFRQAQAEGILIAEMPLSVGLDELLAWAELSRFAPSRWPVPRLNEVGTQGRSINEREAEFTFNDKRSLPLVRAHAIALIQAVVLYGTTS